MEKKYVVVKSNSTTGAYIIEINPSAPAISQSKADIAGYTSTKKQAQRLARLANGDGLIWDEQYGLYRNLKTDELG